MPPPKKPKSKKPSEAEKPTQEQSSGYRPTQGHQKSIMLRYLKANFPKDFVLENFGVKDGKPIRSFCLERLVAEDRALVYNLSYSPEKGFIMGCVSEKTKKKFAINELQELKINDLIYLCCGLEMHLKQNAQK